MFPMAAPPPKRAKTENDQIADTQIDTMDLQSTTAGSQSASASASSDAETVPGTPDLPNRVPKCVKSFPPTPTGGKARPKKTPKASTRATQKSNAPAEPKTTEPKAAEPKAAAPEQGGRPTSFGSSQERVLFWNKIRKAPDKIKDQWKDKFSKLNAFDEDRNTFISNVLEVGKDGFSNEYFQGLLKVESIDDAGQRGRFWTYKEMVDTEGEDAVLEMANFKTCDMRRNPRLPPNSAIPWPRNQEFWKDHDFKDKSTKVTDAKLEKSDHGQMDPEVHEQFRKAAELAKGKKAATMVSKSEEGEGAPNNGPPLEGMRDAIVAAKKAHSEWDRKKRDLEGVVGRSKLNENTKGCKFEQDLEAMIETGIQKDNVLLEYEKKFNTAVKMENEDLVKVKAETEELSKLAKEASKKSSALASWWKL